MADSFGAMLRRTRRSANKTLSEMAEAAGVSIVYLSEVERGSKNPLSTDKILKIASALEVNPVPLIEQADQQRGIIEYHIPAARGLATDVVSGLVAGLQRGGVTDKQLQRIKEVLDEEPKNE
ncbi:MAG: helix-turn-helix transcriptional regulator [Acidobacteriaceae bacterium]|nr:helix-turn-helix transcriptional regulator [Acidobacteriaceae bacterium]